MNEPTQASEQTQSIDPAQSGSAQSGPEQYGNVADLSGLLAADFAYVAQTAFQAAEDRARTTTFYLLAIGSVLATVFASNLENVDPWRTAVAFAVVFGSMSVMGLITLMQLARLRSAWFSSVEAMNHIKAFTLEHSPYTFNDSPFPWMQENLPKRFELKSVGAFLLLQVVVMASVMFGACVFHIGLLINMQRNWMMAAFVGGLLWSVLGVYTYFWALRKR